VAGSSETNNTTTPEADEPRRCCGLKSPLLKLLLVLVLAAGVGLLLTVWFSCEAQDSYRKQWSQEVQRPEDDLLAGHWKGTWQTDGGESSPMSAVISREGEDQYHAKFEAEAVMGPLRFKVHPDVMLTAVKGDERWTFAGSKDLGFFQGGVYEFDGWTDGETFFSTFDSKHYSGTYTMKRVADQVGPELD
jgi:hypothetical protein